jgi:single-strand DNA-binding protein
MINNVVLVGRIVNDPEMRYAQSGTQITKFRIAVSRTRVQEGQQDTDFINIVCFGKTAEFVAQYMDKGSLVGVEGRIQIRQYDDDEGRRTWYTEIAAGSVQALESRQEAERRRAASGSQPAQQPSPEQPQPPEGRPAPAQPAQQPDPFEANDDNDDPFADQ